MDWVEMVEENRSDGLKNSLHQYVYHTLQGICKDGVQ